MRAPRRARPSDAGPKVAPKAGGGAAKRHAASNLSGGPRLRMAPLFPRATQMTVPALMVPFVRAPLRTLCSLAFGGLLCGIVINALLLQKGPHPHPLFAQVPDDAARNVDVTPISLPQGAPATVAPKPIARPNNLNSLVAQTQTQAVPEAPTHVRTVPVAEAGDTIAQQITRSNAPSPTSQSALQPVAAEAKGDQLGSLIRTTSTPAGASKPVLAPMPDPQRVASIQRALIKLGFAVKGAQVDGILGGTTRQAIEVFERRHNLPITGDVSLRLTRLLSAETGIAIP